MSYVIQGTDRRYRLTFTDPDLITGPNPEGRMDLTGATIYYRWKLLQSDPNPAEISKSSVVPAEITILAQGGDTLGQCDVYLIPSDTDTLPVGWHYWDTWIQVASGERYAKIPQRIQLIDAITDLISPSPSPSTGPGDGDDVYSMEYAQELVDGGTSTTLESLGRVPVGSSITSLTAELGEAVTAGSVTVRVLLNSVSVLEVVLNVGNPTSGIDQGYTGIYNLDETDTLEVQIVSAAYANAAAVTADLKVNVGLARTASLGIPIANAARKEPTGLPNRTDTVVSKVDGTRTLTITPTGASFAVWVEGIRYAKTIAEDVIWTDVEGTHWFYYDNTGTLQVTTSWPAIPDTALIAAIQWDAVNKEGVLYEERHGIVMSGATHEYLHDIFGAQHDWGLGITNITIDGGGGLDSHAQFGVADGEFHDEDIEHHIVDGSPQTLSPIAELPVWYLSGAALWRRKTANTFPFVYAGQEGAPGTRVPYNSFGGGVWGWTEVSNNRYVCVHVFGTPGVVEPVATIQGQEDYSNINAARDGAESELANLYTVGLPSVEFVPLATLIIQTGAYANTPKAQFRTVDSSGAEFIDWRRSQVSSIGTAPTIHALGGALHNPDTFAALLTKVSDQILAATDLAQTYSKGQKSTVVTLTRVVAALPITLGDSNSFFHDLEADVTLSAPTDQASKVGQWFTLKVQSNATHELAYNAVYTIATEPDFSAMASNEFVILNGYVHAASGAKSIALFTGGTMGPTV